MSNVRQLPSGKWTHSKTVYEFDEKVGAQMDYRFCCEWDDVKSNSHTESDFQ